MERLDIYETGRAYFEQKSKYSELRRELSLLSEGESVKVSFYELDTNDLSLSQVLYLYGEANGKKFSRKTLGSSWLIERRA